jgi:SAM-dependent methyltransferase
MENAQPCTTFDTAALADLPTPSLRAQLLARLLRYADEFIPSDRSPLHQAELLTIATASPLPELLAEGLSSKLIEDELHKIRRMPQQAVLLGYDSFQRLQHLNRRGTFFTSHELANYVATELLAPATASARILDPACGSGVFLIEALRVLCRQLHRSPAEIVTHIYGIDIDPIAIELSRIALTLECWRLDETLPRRPISELTHTIRCGDFLIDPTLTHFLNPTLPHFNLGQAFGECFDFVMGNPPYGISRDQQMSEAEESYYREVYAHACSGKINKYLLFMARGLSLLAPSGRLSFIVPNAWLGIRDGMAVRKLLFQQQVLDHIATFEEMLFPSAGVEAVVVTLSTGKNASSFQVTGAKRPGDADIRITNIPYEACLRESDARISLRYSDENAALLSKIKTATFRLGDADSPFVASIALQAYAQGKGTPPQSAAVVKSHPFHVDRKVDSNTYPYLEGNCIERFGYKNSATFLRHGPWLAEPQSIDRFTGPRLLVREVLGKDPYLLQACFIEETALYNKSVLHIRPRMPTSSIFLWALLGILCSRLTTFIIKNCGRKSQRKLFPKLVLADLHDLPLPKAHFSLPESDEIRALAHLAQRASLGEMLDAEIDAAVFSLYSVPYA